MGRIRNRQINSNYYVAGSATSCCKNSFVILTYIFFRCFKPVDRHLKSQKNPYDKSVRIFNLSGFFTQPKKEKLFGTICLTTFFKHFHVYRFYFLALLTMCLLPYANFSHSWTIKKKLIVSTTITLFSTLYKPCFVSLFYLEAGRDAGSSRCPGQRRQ